MDGWKKPEFWPQSGPDWGCIGADEVSRLWVGLEHQQEVLGPIAVELMALLCPDVPGVNPPGSGTDITSRG